MKYTSLGTIILHVLCVCTLEYKDATGSKAVLQSQFFFLNFGFFFPSSTWKYTSSFPPHFLSLLPLYTAYCFILTLWPHCYLNRCFNSLLSLRQIPVQHPVNIAWVAEHACELIKNKRTCSSALRSLVCLWLFLLLLLLPSPDAAKYFPFPGQIYCFMGTLWRNLSWTWRQLSGNKKALSLCSLYMCTLR